MEGEEHGLRRTAHAESIAHLRTRLTSTPIEKMADLLAQVKADGGRIFFLGVGGSAGNCSHAVNDFRKIVGIECYAPTDNVSELTARTNDEGWATIFVEWLKVSKLQRQGCVVHLLCRRRQSGKEHQPQSRDALKYARSVGAKIIGVVGRDGGYTAQVADACVHHSDGQPGNDHAAFRSVPGGRLASVGLASETEGQSDQVGVDRAQMKRGRLSGS